jgi:hypothetical protein
MLSKIYQRVQAVGQSLAGDGMLLRLRNVSIALVGAVAAVGLGLTLFISQLGFPAVFSGPIPGNPTTKVGTLHDAVALTHSPGAAPQSPSRHAKSSAAAGARHRPSGGVNGGDTSLGGSHELADSPGTQASPTAPPGAAVPVSGPTAPSTGRAPSVPVSTPAPAAAGSPSKPSPAGQSKGASDAKSKSSPPAVVKATSGGSASAPTLKSGVDQSGAASAPAPVTSTPGPVAGEAPAATSPAAAKEAADSGR